MTQSYELAQELLDQLGWACPESEKRVIANFITAQREKIIAALRSDGEQCDCFAKEECECACGACGMERSRSRTQSNIPPSPSPGCQQME